MKVTVAASLRRHAPRVGFLRLRTGSMRILQTALAAVCAYYLALLLPLEDSRPVFASIAAVIAVGATHGQRGRRALELTAGVGLGLTAADLIVHTIGTGPLQTGLVIVLAMGGALMLGGGELLVTEAAVTALLLVSLEPSSGGPGAERILEALLGGAVALAVSSLVFPPSPALDVSRAAQRVFGDLGSTLEQVAAALAAGDHERAESGLLAARGMEGPVKVLDEALVDARQAARLSPPRRASGETLDRYARTQPHLDYAVRNSRVLARHALRYTRGRGPAPAELSTSVDELAQAVWSLAAAMDEPHAAGKGREAGEARDSAQAAAAHAREAFDLEPDLVLTEIVSQVRSTAADLMRAADLVPDRRASSSETPTEELLVVPRAPATAPG